MSSHCAQNASVYRRIANLGLLAAWTGLDQVTKQLAHSMVPLAARKEFLPGFGWTHGHNPGAAFSLLADAGGWQRPALTAVALVVAAAVVVALACGRLRGASGVAWALIAAGALSNAIDRVRLGFVEDFIGLHVMNWHWPAFNLADVGVVAGVSCLVWLDFKARRKSSDSFRNRHQ